MKKNIFVSAATGFQGSNIARLLQTKGNETVTLSRAAHEAYKNEFGMHIVPGNLADQSTISAALQGVEKAVFTLPLLFDLEMAKQYTSNFIAAAESEDVSLVVFNVGFDLPNQATGLLTLDIKTALYDLFQASDLNVITLVPDIYIDNIAAPWSIPVILENGILPYPVKSGVKLPWISHSDLAKYVVSALEKLSLASETLSIGGNLFSGEELAKAISNRIEKPVKFVSLTPNEFEKQLIPAFGELAAKEISNLYRYVENNRKEITSKDFASTHKRLGVSPQSLEDWVASIEWNN